MNHKQSLLGVHSFYNVEEAVELLTNMSDCEDESTSDSENEGDSSDSSEDTHLWMKAHVLLRAESISSGTTPKSQTGSILNFLWSVN